MKKAEFLNIRFFTGIIVGMIFPILLLVSIAKIGNASHTQNQTSVCMFTGKATIWDDRNENGKLEPGESPLEGVNVDYVEISPEVHALKMNESDKDGKVDISFYDCELIEMKIVAEIPEGYTATTPTEYIVDIKNLSTGEWRGGDFYFGFKRK